MRGFFSVFLSLGVLASCTTLTSRERCALIGQIQTGTQIGTQTHVGSVGSTIYSYNTPSYNPICKIPSTDEEKIQVANLLPQAKEKNKKRNTELWVTYGAIIITPLLLLPLMLENRRNQRPYYRY